MKNIKSARVCFAATLNLKRTRANSMFFALRRDENDVYFSKN